MTVQVTDQKIYYDPIAKHFIRVGGTKNGPLGAGMYADQINADGTVGWEQVVRMDGDAESTAVLLPDRSLWVFGKGGSPAQVSIYDGKVSALDGSLLTQTEYLSAVWQSKWPQYDLKMAAPWAVVASDGNVYVAAIVASGGQTNRLAVFRFNKVLSIWDKQWLLSGDCGTAPNPRMVAGPGGIVHILYRANTANNMVDLFALAIENDSIFVPVQDISNEFGWVEPTPSMDIFPDGTVIAAWVAPPPVAGSAAGIATARYTPQVGWAKVSDNMVGNPWSSLGSVAVACAPDNKTCFMVAGSANSEVYVYRSQDKGLSYQLWQRWNNGNPVPQVAAVHGNGQLAVGSLDSTRNNHFTMFPTTIPDVDGTPAPTPNPTPTPTPTPASSTTIVNGFLVKETNKFYPTGPEVKL